MTSESSSHLTYDEGHVISVARKSNVTGESTDPSYVMVLWKKLRREPTKLLRLGFGLSIAMYCSTKVLKLMCFFLPPLTVTSAAEPSAPAEELALSSGSLPVEFDDSLEGAEGAGRCECGCS